MLSLRVSRDKRGYDYIYLLLEARRRGRVENRLLYCGRWPTPCRVGTLPFDDETRARLEEAHPDVAFDWPALLKTLQAALGVSRPPAPGGPPPPPQRSSRRPDRPGAMPPAYGGGGGGARPGQPRRPGGPPAPRPSEPVPVEAMEPESEPDYAATEVVLVTADLEEHESSYVAPEFDVVHEAEQTFAASFDVELANEGTVEIPIPEATESATVSAGGHTFAPTIEEGQAAAGVDAEADGEENAEGLDDEADAADEIDEADEADGAGVHAAQAEPGTPASFAVAGDTSRPAEVGPPGAAGDPNRPHRRRRRRGGRGRGKPPEGRSGSE